MMDAAGDKKGFEKEALKIKNAQTKYNTFCKETGRTKSLDRTQAYEYNKVDKYHGTGEIVLTCSGERKDNFKIIYKILKILEQAMDYEKFDYSLISAEQLNIT